MLFSPTTRGFYIEGLHDNVPDDVVTIPDERHAELLAGEASGKIIEPDSAGMPRLLDRPLRERRDIAWAEIKRERDRRTQSGGYKVGAHWFHSDPFSRIQQLGLKAAGPDMPPGVPWKTMSGEFVVMTPEIALQVFQAAIASDIAIFAAAERHREAMQACSEPEAYDFSNGWPVAFGEEE